MTRTRCLALLLAVAPLATIARGQETYKIEPLKEGPPAALADAVKQTLGDQGFRVVDGQGKPFADLWVRKAVPASGKPAGPKGTVLFPVLAEGELLGAVRFGKEAGDYRDQPIAPGVYTIRYALQPVNGDHLGVSPYRDYGLLVPAKVDKTLAPTPKEKLEDESAGAAGTNHPAVFMMLAAPPSSGGTPSLVRDEEKNLWGAVLPLPLEVKGESAPAPLNVQLVIVGAAML
jgi:hypothetical protein